MKRITYDLLSPERAEFVVNSLLFAMDEGAGAEVDSSRVKLTPRQVRLLAALSEDDDGHIDTDGRMWIGGTEFLPAPARFAAQAVTVDGYGDPEIVMQGIADDDWPSGDVVANVPIDGDFTSAADLDHALTGAGYTRVSDWEPAPFGSIATVVKEG